MVNYKLKTAGIISLATVMLLGGQISATHVRGIWNKNNTFREDFEFEKAEVINYDEMHHVKLSKDNNDLDLYKFVPRASGTYEVYISNTDADFLIGVIDYEKFDYDLQPSDVLWYSERDDDLTDFNFVKDNTYYIIAWTVNSYVNADYWFSFVNYKGDGNPYAGWRCMDGSWCYMYEDGTYAEGWTKIDGKWYFFNYEKEMQTGWIKDGGKWYFLSSSGEMATGWISDNGNWYYLKSSGEMSTGWINDNGSWYFLKSSGQMAENEYCNGYWLGKGGKWTYEYKASWKLDSKGWYYQDTSGWYAKNSSYKIDGKVYIFNSEGYCTNP